MNRIWLLPWQHQTIQSNNGSAWPWNKKKSPAQKENIVLTTCHAWNKTLWVSVSESHCTAARFSCSLSCINWLDGGKRTVTKAGKHDYQQNGQYTGFRGNINNHSQCCSFLLTIPLSEAIPVTYMAPCHNNELHVVFGAWCVPGWLGLTSLCSFHSGMMATDRGCTQADCYSLTRPGRTRQNTGVQSEQEKGRR